MWSGPKEGELQGARDDVKGHASRNGPHPNWACFGMLSQSYISILWITLFPLNPNRAGLYPYDDSNGPNWAIGRRPSPAGPGLGQTGSMSSRNGAHSITS